METNKKEPPSEDAGDGYPIEIYTDERIRDFLAEDELTPEEKKRLEEKLKESIKLNSSPPSERS
ncbi:MAG: hypothetical protein OEV48_08810 [Acidobacteriota bacterium]|jgi:hypothetical protein|nr:hypothetical protein [Acidobacteriota bacterium]